MRNFKFIIAMLVLAVFAVGAVSAAEDIAIEDNTIDPADDIVVEDVDADDVDESASDVEEDIAADVNDENQGTRQNYDVYETDSMNYIQGKIDAASPLNATSHVVNFAPGTYNDTALIVRNNTILYGNGATLVGSGSNIFTIADANNFTISGFNIITNSTEKTAFYGANVFNANIEYNNITGGKDGINIMQTYGNVTINGNKIENVKRDAISLVDHETDGAGTFNFTTWDNSIISNNVIIGKPDYETEYGMFIGGNFKGTISGNTITGVATGMEFAGKKAKTNGKLCAVFDNNNITDVGYGINMFHPNVVCLNITNCNIGINSSNIEDAIATNDKFNYTGYMGVYNSNFSGAISPDFVTAVGNHKGNNTGFP